MRSEKMFNYDFESEFPITGGKINQEILELKSGYIKNGELKISGNKVDQDFIIKDMHLLEKIIF